MAQEGEGRSDPEWAQGTGLQSRRVKAGGGERGARPRSSALCRAHEPRRPWTALLSSPGLGEGQRTYKKIQQKKNISLTPKRTLFNEVENSSTQIAFSTTL